jgi:hypothetical protein
VQSCAYLFDGSWPAAEQPAGVLKFKRDSEMALEASGLPYTILRLNICTTPFTQAVFLLLVFPGSAQVQA